MSKHAHEDPYVISQAQALASTSGSSLGSGGAFFPRQQNHKRGPGYGGGGGTGGDGAGGASSQGGAGGGGRGGYIHVSDTRAPPDYGRIAFPEDIFGSLEVDSEGRFVDGTGNYQDSGTYRIITREGWYVAMTTSSSLKLYWSCAFSPLGIANYSWVVLRFETALTEPPIV